MDIRNIVRGITAVFSPFITAIETFFDSFVRDDLLIYDMPYYKWVIGFLIFGLLFHIIMGLIDD